MDYSNILLMLIEQSFNYYELETLSVVSFHHFFLMIESTLQCLYSLSFRKSQSNQNQNQIRKSKPKHLCFEMICFKIGRQCSHRLQTLNRGLHHVWVLSHKASRSFFGMLVTASAAVVRPRSLLSAALGSRAGDGFKLI